MFKLISRLAALTVLLFAPSCEPAEEGCTPGALSCSALLNRVERCGDDGATLEPVETCPGNTCEVIAGVAQCVNAEPQVCTPNTTSCSAQNATVERCNAEGTALTTVETCAGNTCEVIAGTAQCVTEDPQLCTPNATSCSALNNRVEQCNADGTALTTIATCPGNTCIVEDGAARCNTPPLVCEPNALRCSTDPKVVEQCRTDGTAWFSQAPCPGTFECTTASGSAQCQVCVAGDLRCGANDATVDVCNTDGTAYETLQTCDANSCELIAGEPTCELPCEPGATRCNAQRTQVQVCDPTGTVYTAQEPCLNNSCTTDASGAFCTTPQVCSSNSRRCSATDPKVVERCRTDGTGWSSQAPCPGALECTVANGSADCQSCIPGDLQCGSNNASLSACNAAGTRYETLQSCTNNSCKLIGDDFACEFPCSPGTTRCSALRNLLQVCAANGTSYTNLETCGGNSCQVGPQGPFCQSSQACTANSRRCSTSDPDVVEQCRADGSGWVATTCGGALECTTATGSAQCQACVPGSRQCGPNDSAVQVCKTDGSGFETLQSCSNNSCTLASGQASCELPCSPGVTRCNALRSQVQVCAAGGTSYTTQETCLSNSCTADPDGAFCATPQVCTPNTRRCSSTDPRIVEQCRADGSGWSNQSTCAGALTCTTASGAAACLTCTPGSLNCGANNASLRECNAEGTAFTTIESCTANSCKLIGSTLACEYPCDAGETRCNPLRSGVQVCDESGLSVTSIESCLNNSCTVGPLGAYCQTPQACTPNTRRCSATNPNVVEQCNSAGSAWTAATTCQGGLQCGTASGVAACQLCVPDTLRCASNNTRLERCDEAGSAFLLEDTCSASSCKLIGSSLLCEYPCDPGTSRCNPLRTQVQVCDATGLTHSALDTCVANSCTSQGDLAFCAQPRICTPLSTRCSTTTPGVVEVCDSDGSSWRTQTTCQSGRECLATESGATCQTCTPGARTCGADNGNVRVCNSLGSAWETESTCLGNTCKTSSGITACELPCTPSMRRCSPLNNYVQECNAAGDAWANVATCAQNSCTDAASGVSCSPPALLCEPGATRCSTLGTQVQTCNVAGSAWDSTQSCPGADCAVVEGGAICAAPVCAANTPFCGDDNKVYFCDSRGQVSGVKADCGGTSTCLTFDGIAQCVAPDLAFSCEPNLQFCEDNTIYYCSGTGVVSGVRQACSEDEVCAIEAQAPICVEGFYTPDPGGGEPTCVLTSSATCIAIPRGGTVYGYIWAEVDKPSCDEPSQVVRECSEREQCRLGQCTSSVLDPSSPYYSASCPLEQQLDHPTALPADCRCFTNNGSVNGVPICGRPYDRGVQGVMVGQGPRVVGLANGRYNGGELVGNTLYVAASWGGSTAQKGAVLAVDLTTGDRTLISGELGQDTAGSGPALSWVIDVRKGPDGNLYALTQALSPAAPTIVRIRPSTGQRTVVWRGQDAAFGQCPAGDPDASQSVQYTNSGFAVDTSGRFYLGYANAIRDGRGVVRISADGTSCAYLTASGTREDGLIRGAGPALGGFVQGFSFKGNALIATTTQPKSLVSIDLTSGDRTVLFTGANAGAIGERWTAWDPTRNLYWTVGLMNSVTIVAFDPARNKTLDVFQGCGDPAFPWYPLCPGAGPIKINSLNYGGFWVHPQTGNLWFAQDGVSIVELEVGTANSVIRSL